MAQGQGSEEFGAASEGGIQRYFDANGVIQPRSMGRAMRDALREPDPVKSNLMFTQLLSELTARKHRRGNCGIE